jgi:hypothetical protein
LQLLIGQGRHPITGGPLGRDYRTFRSTAQLIARYAAVHGRQPTAATKIKLRQQATLCTRPTNNSTPWPS